MRRLESKGHTRVIILREFFYFLFLILLLFYLPSPEIHDRNDTCDFDRLNEFIRNDYLGQNARD